MAHSLDWNELGKLIEGLAYAQRPIHAAVRAITKQLGLGPRGAFILNLLSEGAEFPSELSSKLGTSRSLITADLTRLIDAGLIKSATDAADKRMTRLHLTASGQAVCAEARAEMRRIVTRNLAAFSVEDVRRFSEMLEAVRRLEPKEID
jgi:DNA-binding MarR family transcriptional regulator